MDITVRGRPLSDYEPDATYSVLELRRWANGGDMHAKGMLAHHTEIISFINGLPDGDLEHLAEDEHDSRWQNLLMPHYAADYTVNDLRDIIAMNKRNADRPVRVIERPSRVMDGLADQLGEVLSRIEGAPDTEEALGESLIISGDNNEDDEVVIEHADVTGDIPPRELPHHGNKKRHKRRPRNNSTV